MPTVPEVLYSTTEMLKSFEQIPPAETFLNNTFFGDVSYFDGKLCQVDYRKARRLLAPIVRRGQFGRVVKRPPVRTSFFDVPTIAPIRPLTVADLEDRDVGATVYDSRSAADRLAFDVADDYVDLRESVSRRLEWMTSQLLFEGKISYPLDDGSTESLDYGSPIEIIPPLPWTDDDSDPFRDFVDADKAILTETGYQSDTIVFGAEAVEVWLRHKKVQLWLDIRRFNLVQVEPEVRAGTAQFLGNLTRPGCSMYSYIEQAEMEDSTAENPSVQPMVPDDVVLIGSSRSGSRTAYGSITQMENNGDTITVRGQEYVPLILNTPKQQERTFRLASRPCLIPSDLGAWRIIRPFATPPPPRKVAKTNQEVSKEVS